MNKSSSTAYIQSGSYPEWSPTAVYGSRYGIQPDLLQRTQSESMTFPTLLGLGMCFYLCGVVIFSQKSSVLWLPQLIGAIVGIAWLAWSIVTGTKIALPRYVTWYVLWMIWASVTMPLSGSLDPYGPIWLTQVKICLMTILASQCIKKRADLLAIMLALSLASIVVFTLGSQNVMEAVNYERYQTIRKSRATATLLGNVNFLGFYAILVVMGAATCILAYRSKLLKLTAAALLPFGYLLLKASGSRKGMACLLIIAAGLYWHHFRKIWRGFAGKLVALVLGVGLIAGAAVVISHMPTVNRLTKTVFTKEARFIWFVRGLDIVANNPVFGLGIGGFAMAGESGRVGIYSHSTITESLTNTGIPGFVLYFSAQGALFLQLRRVRKLDLPPRDKAVANCCMCIFWIWMLYHVFAVMFDNRLACPIMGAIAGYCLSLENTFKNRQFDTLR